MYNNLQSLYTFPWNIFHFLSSIKRISIKSCLSTDVLVIDLEKSTSLYKCAYDKFSYFQQATNSQCFHNKLSITFFTGHFYGILRVSSGPSGSWCCEGRPLQVGGVNCFVQGSSSFHALYIFINHILKDASRQKCEFHNLHCPSTCKLFPTEYTSHTLSVTNWKLQTKDWLITRLLNDTCSTACSLQKIWAPSHNTQRIFSQTHP
jgi:hypothetical protein